VERLLLLWDELDEYMSYGRHMVARWGIWRGSRTP
jgi:hypothetical protein